MIFKNRKLFGLILPHVTRACQGVIFHSVSLAKQFMQKAKTNTDLKVTVDVLTGIYETGKSVLSILFKICKSLVMNICPTAIIVLMLKIHNSGGYF